MHHRISLITHSKPKSPISEAYRVLRTNIQFSSIDKPLKVIAVTSTGPGEGKTTTVSNLAVTFAQSGSKTLVIDADLRKPTIHRAFGLLNTTGLTNVLVQHYDYTDCLHAYPEGALDLLLCGAIPPNPSELLSSIIMKNFIQKIRNDYDIIIIDTPPVGTVTDAAILSTIVDGTILVVSSGKIEYDSAARAKELLQKVNANIIGVVLNNLVKNAQGNYYYYYYYYYGENNEGAASKTRKKNRRKIPVRDD